MNEILNDRGPELEIQEQLRQRWNGFWERLGVDEADFPDFNPIIQHYSEKGRFYHTLNHVAHCLSEFDGVRHLLHNPDAVEMAIFLHDVIYDINQTDNEEQSAEFAKNLIANVYTKNPTNYSKLSPDFGEQVADLIKATKHITIPQNYKDSVLHDALFIIDIDLCILGQPPKIYEGYRKKIREEYREKYTDKEFSIGRTGFLSQVFLDKNTRPAIFLTPAFNSKYEEQARNNMDRELEDYRKLP